jgi:hypothetical protein
MKVNGQFETLYSERLPSTHWTGGRDSLGAVPLTAIFIVCAVCEGDIRTNLRELEYEMDLSGSGWDPVKGRLIHDILMNLRIP